MCKDADRIMSKLELDSVTGCWNWTGIKNAKGYGRVRYRARQRVRAHRIIPEILGQAVPADKQIDHLCRNKGCCNPAHLEPVTRRENIRRAWSDKWRRDAARRYSPDWKFA